MRAAGARCDVLGAGYTTALHFQHNPLVVSAWLSSDGNHLNSADFPEVPGRPSFLTRNSESLQVFEQARYGRICLSCRGEKTAIAWNINPSARRIHMKRALFVLLIAGVALAAGSRIQAHHSFAATYFEDQTVSIEGNLVQ